MNINKVIIDLERLRYPFSGIANVFRNLRKGIEMQDHNLNISFFGDFESTKNQVGWRKWHKFYEGFSASYDLIHVSHQLSSYFHKNYKNSIKIVTLHDLNFLHENLSLSKRNKMLKKVSNNLKNADYIVCISQYAKQDFLENKHLFTLNKLKGIEVIHNGILLPEPKNYPLGTYEFLKSKSYIFNIGVLFDKKNQLKLVEMLPFIDQDLVLLASEEKQPYASIVKTRIKELNLEHRVHFLKRLSEEEKYAVIQHCDALCHPSIAEGFGIPPIEAMAFGKPVFLSKFASLPEIGGDSAFYFDSFDPAEMAAVFKDRMNFYNTNKETLVPEIKKWTLQFDYRKMSINYIKFYQKVLKN